MNKDWELLLNAENDLPLELASNAMVMQGNTIMVYGGTGFPFGVNCSNKLYVYHPEWNRKRMEEIQTRGEKPPPQYGQAIVCHENFLYTIGGTEGFDYTCDVYRLECGPRGCLSSLHIHIFSLQVKFKDSGMGVYVHMSARHSR
jgi:hypothetical protein